MMILKQLLALISVILTAGAAVAADKDDHWSYLENGLLRIGVDQSRGAGIGFLALSEDNRNLLNHHDTGRFIQQSYCGNADGSMWAKQPWRYNPVQGGSYKGEQSKILAFRKTDQELYSKIEPLHWANAKTCPEAWRIFARAQRVISLGPRVCDSHVHEPGKSPPFETSPFASHGRAGLEIRAPSAQRPVQKSAVALRRSCRSGSRSKVRLRRSGCAWTSPARPTVNYRARGKLSGPTGGACSYVAPIRTLKLTKGQAIDYEFYFTIGTLVEIRARFDKVREIPYKVILK